MTCWALEMKTYSVAFLVLLLQALIVTGNAQHNASSLLMVHSGYWKISNNSTSVLQCPYGVISCHGGELSGDASCASHFEGFLCSVPLEGLFIDWTFRDAFQCNSTVLSLSLLASLVVGIGLPFWICCCIGNTKDPKKFIVVKERGEDANEFKSRTLLKDSASTEDSTIDGISSEFLSFKSFTQSKGDKETRQLEITTIDQNNAVTMQFLAKLKIVIFSMQIISSLPNSLMRQLPHSSTSILKLYSYLSWASIQALPLNCIADSLGVVITYQNSMELATIIPLMAALLAVFCYLLHIEVLYVISTRSKHFQRKQRQISLRYGTLVGMFVYILWGGVSSVIVGSLDCINVDPGNFIPGSQTVMRNDVSVYCGTTSYKYGYLWTVVALLLYVIALPVLIALILYFYKAAVEKDIESLIHRYETDHLTSETIEQLFHQSNQLMIPSDTPDGVQLQAQQTSRKQGKKGGSKKSAISEASALSAIKKFKNKLSEYYDAIGILHVAYKKDYKYWELFDYLIRFFYVALLPLFRPEDQTSQLLVFIVVTALFLTRTLYCRPFRDSGNQIMFTLSLIQIASVAVCVIILEMKDPESSELAMLDGLLCLSLLSVPSLFVWQTALPALKRYWSGQADAEAQVATTEKGLRTPDSQRRRDKQRRGSSLQNTPSTMRSSSSSSSRRTRSSPRTPDSFYHRASGGGGGGGVSSGSGLCRSTSTRLPTYMDGLNQWEQYQLSLQHQQQLWRLSTGRSLYEGPSAAVPPSPDSTPPPSPPPTPRLAMEDCNPYYFEQPALLPPPPPVSHYAPMMPMSDSRRASRMQQEQMRRYHLWEQRQQEKQQQSALRQENERMRRQLTEQTVQLERQERMLLATGSSVAGRDSLRGTAAGSWNYHEGMEDESKMADWSDSEDYLEGGGGGGGGRLCQPMRVTSNRFARPESDIRSGRLRAIGQPEESVSVESQSRKAVGRFHLPFPSMSPSKGSKKATAAAAASSVRAGMMPRQRTLQPPPPTRPAQPAGIPSAPSACVPLQEPATSAAAEVTRPRPPPPPPPPRTPAVPSSAAAPVEALPNKEEGEQELEQCGVSVQVTVGGSGGGSTTLRVPTSSLPGTHLDYNPHDTFDTLLEEALLTEQVLNLEYGDIYSDQSEDMDDTAHLEGKFRIKTVKNKETGRMERYRRTDSADFSSDEYQSEDERGQFVHQLPLNRVV